MTVHAYSAASYPPRNWLISLIWGLYPGWCEAVAKVLYSAGQNRYADAAAQKIAKNICSLLASVGAICSFRHHTTQRLHSARTNGRMLSKIIMTSIVGYPPYSLPCGNAGCFCIFYTA